MSDEHAERYRQAAENALRQLDWCVSYFRRIHKGRISAQLAKNAAHIRSALPQGGRRAAKGGAERR